MKPAAYRIHNAGLHHTRWGKAIIRAEGPNTDEEPGFTMYDHVDANGWTSCACGYQDDRLHNPGIVGAPWDDQLYSLGMDFGEFVSMDDFENAAITLIAIEDRAVELLSNML